MKIGQNKWMLLALLLLLACLPSPAFAATTLGVTLTSEDLRLIFGIVVFVSGIIAIIYMKMTDKRRGYKSRNQIAKEQLRGIKAEEKKNGKKK